MHKRHLAVVGIVLVVVTIIFASVTFRQQAQDKLLSKWDNAPIVDFNAPEPSNEKEKEIRKLRGKKYKTRTPLDKMEDLPAVFQLPSAHSPVEQALPVLQSDIIIIGTITNSKAFISNDKTAVYSEFQVSVNQIIKNNKALSITSESNIIVDRIGGKVRFPSGKIQPGGYLGHNLPQKNKQYVLFLKWEEEGKDYSIVTGYEVQGKTIYPLDGLEDENLRFFSNYNQYKNANLAEFLTKLQEVILNPTLGEIKQLITSP